MFLFWSWLQDVPSPALLAAGAMACGANPSRKLGWQVAVTASIVLLWLLLMGCWCCWGAKRNGAEKYSCYNDLLFSAGGSRVQFRTVTSFRYRDTDGQKRIGEAVTAQQERFRTGPLSISSP